MSEKNATLLKRKIASASERRAKAALQNSLVADLELYVAKVFLKKLFCEVEVTVRDSSIKSATDAIETLRPPLYGVLDLYGGVGICGCDAHFVNTATTGLLGATISEKPAEERSISATDAALTGMLIDTILKEVFFHGSPPEEPENSGQTFGMTDHKTKKAPLIYMLTEKRYACLRIGITGKNAINYGEFTLVIPLTCIEAFSAMDAENTPEELDTSWVDAMEAATLHTPLELDSVLQRISLSLETVLSFKKGQLLEMPSASITQLTLECATQSGRVTIFQGQLGAMNTYKAFRVTRVSCDEAAQQSMRNTLPDFDTVEDTQLSQPPMYGNAI